MFLFSFDANDIGFIEDALVWADAPNSVIQKVSENVYAGRRNEGFCYSDPSLRRSVAAVGLTTSGAEFVNSTVHEITHVAQHISDADGIDPLSEEFAYLAGDITSGVSDIVCEYSCPHCNRM